MSLLKKVIWSTKPTRELCFECMMSLLKKVIWSIEPKVTAAEHWRVTDPT
jgi:hypothetical protein